MLYLKFPVVELPTRGVTFTEVGTGLDTNLRKSVNKILARIVDVRSLLVGGLGSDSNGNDDDLNGRHTRRQHQSLVIAMNHDHDTNRSRRQTPAVLPDEQLVDATASSSVGVFYDNVEHLGEVLSQAVRSASLDTASRSWDEAFDGGGVETSGELLLFRLDTWDDGDSEQIDVNLAVEF